MWRLVAVLAALMSAGCAQREYTYSRNEPAIGRGSPTVFSVRIRVDRDDSAVTWIEHVYDADGMIDESGRTLTGCTILDENNWEWCIDESPNERVWMRDGRLHQDYWGEHRVYRSWHVAFGRRLRF